ncbi:hypothetical protein PMAYCL1PPCAC_22710 [Pristionchus mayeri]|uniref:Uncharacterized protein n=1 Tax=Pristionchus mayeri TaxID=1317129 RepID=A0AAN5I5V8_9BILA|nr:hypothetical protein PMAYCL1PPCAC_22710 [Pristionchus mayeri]
MASSEYHQLRATLVSMVNPCISLISSFNAAVTALCCCTLVSPLNSVDSMITWYIEPHPPDISWTTILLAAGNFFCRMELSRASPAPTTEQKRRRERESIWEEVRDRGEMIHSSLITLHFIQYWVVRKSTQMIRKNFLDPLTHINS